MTQTEALRLALEALKNSWTEPNYEQYKIEKKAITAIKAALEAKDEPVAWATREDFYRQLEHARNLMRQQMKIKSVTMRCTDYDLALPIIDIFDGRILVGQVTTPPQRTWVGLTDEEIEVIEVLRAPPVHPDFVDCDDWVEFARAIEAKLKEKNT